MISQNLLKEYMNMSLEYGTSPFSLREASELVQKPPRVMRNDIHKLKKGLGLVSLGYGKYELVHPERWINIVLAIERFPRLREFFVSILPKLKDTEMIMLYGSRIRGDFRKDSDFDVLIVTKEKEVFSKEEINELENDGFSIYLGSWSYFSNKIRESPIMAIPILKEGQPVFNGHIREELLKKFRWKNLLKDFNEMGQGLIRSRHAIRKGMGEDLKRSIIYLTFVTFRQIYLAETLIENREYGIEGMLEKLRTIWGGDVKEVYDIHRKVHNSKNPRIKGITERQLSSLVKSSQRYLKATMDKYVNHILK